MKIKSIFKFPLLAAAALATLASCAACSSNDPEKTDPKPEPEPEPTPVVSEGFAKGADISWLTQLEAEGYKFYDAAGKQMECMELLRDQCGINAVRLRVWVNPADGYNSKADVLAKAKRADALGLRLMIDFHFSDNWADPGQQVTPEAWKNYDLVQLKKAVTDHVTDVMTALKDAGITPAWAQIGNETADGFMYPVGKIGENPKNFAELITTGHKAVKAVFPNCITIVHTDSGDNKWRYEYVFGTLAKYNAEYDMIGVSFYPEVKTWKAQAADLIANLKTAKATYKRPTMVCEIGFNVHEVAAGTEMMKYVYDNCQDGVSEGIFYWEPEAPVGYNGGYDKGCFIDGKPTSVLDCFK